MRNRYETPLCSKGCGIVETQTHKFATCFWVSDVWHKMLDIISRMEPSMVFETSHDVLHLNFPKHVHENSILWLIGQYVQFIEEETFIRNKRVSVSQFIGHLSAKRMDSRHQAMPYIADIPGLFPTGVG